jgi:tetratricopeptide (TPR) repeat protein
MPKAKTEALRALEINPGLAEAHFALGSVQHWYDWDWAGAESSYQQAIALNPSDVSAHLEYSVFMAYLGRLDEAVSESKRAVELDPISLHANRYLGYVYYVGRRYHQALDQFLRTVELDPSFFPLYWHLGLVYMATGEKEKAFQAFEQGRSLASGDPVSESLAGWAYGLSGNHQQAQQILVGAHERRKQRYFSGLLLAMLHSGLGEREEAFEWLEVGYQERDGLLLTLKVDPAHDALRSDARFSDLLHRIGF